jgi:hypothetical protein
MALAIDSVIRESDEAEVAQQEHKRLR